MARILNINNKNRGNIKLCYENAFPVSQHAISLQQNYIHTYIHTYLQWFEIFDKPDGRYISGNESKINNCTRPNTKTRKRRIRLRNITV